MAVLDIIARLTDQASDPAKEIDSSIAGIGNTASGPASAGLVGLQSVGKIAMVGLAAGAAIAAAAIISIGAASVSVQGDMKQATTAIIVGTGASGDALEEMEDSVVSLAGSTSGLGHEMSAIGGVMAEVNTRTGLAGSALEDTTGQFLDFTRLAGGDGVRNVQLVTRVMGDWGVENEDTGATLDMLFGAGQAFGIGVDSLATKVVQFGAPMRQMGFTMEESIALFGKWEKEGVNAELAIGSLRIAAGKFARENIPLQEGLRDTMAAIQGATNESEGLAIAMDVFGARAGPDMAAAIREGRFELDGAIDALRSTEGGLQDAADRTIDFRDRFTVMMSQARLSLLPLGDSLANIAEGIMPQLQTAIETTLPIINDILTNSVIPAVEVAVTFFTSLFTQIQMGQVAITPIITTFQNIWMQLLIIWQTLQPVILTVMAAITEFVSWQDILIVLAASIAAVVVPAIISIITTLAPIIAAVLAVVAIVALLRNAWETDFGGIQDKTQAVITFVQNLITTVMTAVKEFWAANGDEIMTKAEEVWEDIKVAVETAVNLLSDIVTAVMTAVMEFWAANGDEIKATAAAVWEFIKTVIETEIEIIRTIITTVFEQLKIFWANYGDAITLSAQTAWAAIVTTVEDAIAIIKKVVEAFTALFEGDWERFGTLIAEIFFDAWELMIKQVKDAIAILLPVVAKLVLDIITKFEEVNWGELGRNIINSVAGAISAGAGAIADAARSAAQAALAAAKAALGIGSPSKLFEEIGLQTVQGFALGIQNNQGLATAAMGRMVQAAVAPVSNNVTTNNIFNVSANYENQREGSVRSDIRTLQLLNT